MTGSTKPKGQMTSRSRLLILQASLALLAACAPQPAAPASPTSAPATTTSPPSATLSATATSSPSPTPPPTVISTTPPPPVVVTTPPTVAVETTATPGIILRGHVTTHDGTGVAGISICRNFASYNGVIVATTDANGYFQSDFAFIPGDEMIGVWPLAAGYTFDPASYRWRHYYGPEDRSLDFVASSSTATAAPPAPCP